MKFTDGFWHTRPGVEAQYAAEAYDLTPERSAAGEQLVIHAPTAVIASRGNTLNRALLTVTLSSPLEGIVRVRVEHHQGARTSPGFDLVGAEEGHGRVHVDDEAGELVTGGLRARVTPGAPWNLTFLDGERELTRSGHKSIGYMRLGPQAPVPAEPTGVSGVTRTAWRPPAPTCTPSSVSTSGSWSMAWANASGRWSRTARASRCGTPTAAPPRSRPTRTCPSTSPTAATACW